MLLMLPALLLAVTTTTHLVPTTSAFVVPDATTRNIIIKGHHPAGSASSSCLYVSNHDINNKNRDYSFNDDDDDDNELLEQMRQALERQFQRPSVGQSEDEYYHNNNHMKWVAPDPQGSDEHNGKASPFFPDAPPKSGNSSGNGKHQAPKMFSPIVPPAPPSFSSSFASSPYGTTGGWNANNNNHKPSTKGGDGKKTLVPYQFTKPQGPIEDYPPQQQHPGHSTTMRPPHHNPHHYEPLISKHVIDYKETELKLLYKFAESNDPVDPLMDLWMHETHNPQDFQVLQDLMNPQYQTGWQSEELQLQTLLEKQPSWAEVHSRLAVVYYMQGRFGRAVATARRALQLKPWHFEAAHTCLLAALRLGQVSLVLDLARTYCLWGSSCIPKLVAPGQKIPHKVLHSKRRQTWIDRMTQRAKQELDVIKKKYQAQQAQMVEGLEEKTTSSSSSLSDNSSSPGKSRLPPAYGPTEGILFPEDDDDDETKKDGDHHEDSWQ